MGSKRDVAAWMAVFALSACSQTEKGLLPVGASQATSHLDTAHQPRSAVPGGCSEPASANEGRAGCYMAAEFTLPSAPGAIYWAAYSFPTAEAAAAAAGMHDWAVTTRSHGLHWAHVLSARPVRLEGGKRHALVGPMALPEGKPMRARFIESVFPPGMQTSVHSHPGAEGFYVLDGVQCMELASSARRLAAGDTMIVPARTVHFQAAPGGRRNVAVVFYPPDEPWMKMEMGWKPSGYCTS